MSQTFVPLWDLTFVIYFAAGTWRVEFRCVISCEHLDLALHRGRTQADLPIVSQQLDRHQQVSAFLLPELWANSSGLKSMFFHVFKV